MSAVRRAVALALLVAMTIFAGYSALAMRTDGLGLIIALGFLWSGTEAIHALAARAHLAVRKGS